VTDVKDPQNWIVNTIGQTLIFADKYIQMDLLLPTQRIYGLGDRHHEFLLSEGAYTMWTSGQAGWYDDGRGRGGLSGAHPFVLYETKVAGVFAGLYFRNSNAMSPVIKFNQDGTTTFSFITIGGQIEVYFIAQGSAHSVIQTYQTMVTFSRLPPFWALGWQEASPALTSGTE
jgi:alpha-glucosidase (family GH31 glycosyl hydrolase)